MNTDIFMDNLEKYVDPKAYDDTYQHYLIDVPLLSEWAKVQGGIIVDLACGTGRVTLPLAEHGHRLIGVDIHEEMLELAKSKSEAKHLPIEWIRQDCTKLALEIKSNMLFMTGNSFQHFLTNESQDALLKAIWNHLNYGGVFIFNTRFPNLKDLAEIYTTKEIYIDNLGRVVTEHTTETYNALTQVLHCSTTREIRDNGTDTYLETDRISLRYVYPLEMQRLLKQNGYEIVEVYSSWKKEELSESSSEMVYVCRKSTV
ncbi:class I SAM-dependent methyltransferase [Salinicoccus sesuvii]|uniref:Class I SAM-dependent methyltransferase n=1 Tax=Salinicoccus sesuvii TaxID=868281 RepID=A0ABV7N6F2_9STAP